MRGIFVTDLHGSISRYEKLYDLIRSEEPDAVFLGGDLLPTFGHVEDPERWESALRPAEGFANLRSRMGERYPGVFLILGNDDPRSVEPEFQRGASAGLWHYAHNARADWGAHSVFGYSFVPPSPFQLKDWERFDVSRYVAPGCVSPEEGTRSVPRELREIRYRTIAQDLESLIDTTDLSRAICLFHSPPSETNLDRAALDGKSVDHVPLDLHVGSIAIRRFIEKHQPLLTLHGHIHESTRITGSWRDRIGDTHMFNAAHDGPELAVVRFDTDDLEGATRELL